MKYKYGKWKCVDNILRLEYTTLEKLTEQYVREYLLQTSLAIRSLP